MVINNINNFTRLAISTSFGINTNLFETNIINLAIVIGTLLFYGRIVLTDIIKNHRENVVKNLQELENKVRESEEILAIAKENLETAKIKAEDIRRQGENLSTQTYKSILYDIEDDIKRLRNLNFLTIKMQQKKSLNDICQKLSLRAFKKAKEILNKRLNSKIHKKIVLKNIEKISKKKLKTKQSS